MVIAVNTRILSGNKAAVKFLIDAFTFITADNPEYQFIFIAENDTAAVPSNSNVKSIIIKQQPGNPLLWKLWYNYRLPSVLRRIKADILVSADGICSLRTKVPQCLLVDDLEFLHHPEWYNKKYSRFAKSTIAACLQKATSILTFSGHAKNELIRKYKTEEDKIQIIYPGTNKNYQPIPWKEREKIKEKYTDGKEYFLFCGGINAWSNLTNLLKAFSLFKKRQKSSMQIVIATDAVPEKNDFVESLRLYKYRDELKMIAGLKETALHLITAAAYGCINLSPLHSDLNFLQNAMQCEVPVIAGDALAAKEILGEAPLYANPSLPGNIAEQMMLVFKDENTRNDMIKKGVEQSSEYSPKNSAGQLWQNILTAAGQ